MCFSQKSSMEQTFNVVWDKTLRLSCIVRFPLLSMVYMFLLDDDGVHAPFIARWIDPSRNISNLPTERRRMCTLRYSDLNISILLLATVIKLVIFCYIVNLDLSTHPPCLTSSKLTRRIWRLLASFEIIFLSNKGLLLNNSHKSKSFENHAPPMPWVPLRWFR